MLEQDLNRNIGIPLYYQLKEILLGEIRNGQLKPGDMIPTELEIKEKLGVSRNVVRQAIGQLVEEGYLVRQKAKGTFVSTPSANLEQIKTEEAFREMVIQQGAVPSTQVLSMEVLDADEKIAELLEIPQKTRVIRVKRLRSANDKPISINTSYMPYALCSFVLEYPLETVGLHHVLGQRYDTRIYRSTRKMEARISSQEEADLLQTEPDSVVQCMTRRSYNRTNMIVEATFAIYRGDFELSFDTVVDK